MNRAKITELGLVLVGLGLMVVTGFTDHGFTAGLVCLVGALVIGTRRD